MGTSRSGRIGAILEAIGRILTYPILGKPAFDANGRPIRRKKIPWHAHPTASLVGSGLCIVTAVGICILHSHLEKQIRSALAGTREVLGDTQPSDELNAAMPMFNRTIGRSWWGLLLGMVVGLPIVLLEKRHLRDHTEFHAELSLLPNSARFRWSVYKVDMMCHLRVTLGMVMAIGLAWLLQVSMVPAGMGVLIPGFLTYPEQKEIYLAAQRKFGQVQEE